MTPADALARLTAAERNARSAGDGSYADAAAMANPGVVVATAEPEAADALAREFLNLAESMQELDVDARTICDALDMVGAEQEVAEAARALRLALAEAEDAEQQTRLAIALPLHSPCDGCHSAKATAIEMAQDAVNAADAKVRRARAWLREALLAAADLAASMSAGLQRRHGGIKAAADDASVPMADRDFYQPARA